MIEYPLSLELHETLWTEWTTEIGAKLDYHSNAFNEWLTTNYKCIRIMNNDRRAIYSHLQFESDNDLTLFLLQL
jgi:hypothetical protein